jgi:ABC-type nitrate/sulfonate/bicarbonate transport system substrate-binding protein
LPRHSRRARRGRGRAALRALIAIGSAAILAAGIAHFLGKEPIEAVRSQTAEPASALMPVGMRLMGQYGPEFAGEMLAERAGLFKAQGLAVTLFEDVDAGAAIDAVASGRDAVGVTRADSFLVARSKGARIVAFAASFIESPVAFYVLKRSGLYAAQDFGGKRIGRRAGDDTEIAFEALATKLLLPRSTMHEFAVTSDLALLTEGKLDIWPGHLGKEDYALTKLGVDYRIISPASYGVHLPGTVYFTSEAMLREHPGTVQSFLKSVIAGWELAYADPGRAVPLIESFGKEKLAEGYVGFALRSEREAVRPIAARFCEFDEAHWRSLQDILLSQRLIDEPVDISSAVTYEYLDEAYRKPFTYGK